MDSGNFSAFIFVNPIFDAIGCKTGKKNKDVKMTGVEKGGELREKGVEGVKRVAGMKREAGI